MTRARLRRAFLLTLLPAIATTAGCRARPDARDVSVAFEIAPSPAAGTPLPLAVSIVDAAGRAVPGARLQVEATMSHAGMAPVFATPRDLGDGRYVARLAFTMAGDWVLLLTGTLPDGRALDRRFDVPGVRPAA